jgi:hypothetical protein
MIKFKKILFIIVPIILLVAVCLNIDKIKDEFKNIFKFRDELIILPANEFKRNHDYMFVQRNDTYIPNNYQDLLNIFYSVLNNGWEEFTFYCSTEYETCLEDLDKISHDQVLLADINNYVNPFNSYSSIRTLYDDTGEVTIIVHHLYNNDEVKKLYADIKKIVDEKTSPNMSQEQQIKVLHDYIIENTKYDSVKANDGDSNYDSGRINGLLYQHYALCSAYTDTMAVMLDYLNIYNFKISTDNHIWNAVYVDGKWKHLDLTWDDPVTSSGREMINDEYFLIDTDELLSIKDSYKQHTFNKYRYLEFK